MLLSIVKTTKSSIGFFTVGFPTDTTTYLQAELYEYFKMKGQRVDRSPSKLFYYFHCERQVFPKH